MTPERQERIRVLDLSSEPAGRYAGRLLATHGVEVIGVEPPGGAAYRRIPPFADDRDHPDRSLLAAYLESSKSSVVIDVETEAGREALERLIHTADAVIVNDERTGWPRLEPNTLAARHPDLVVTSITPFGLDGPHRNLPASPIVLEAMSGWLYQTGNAGEEPVRIRGELASAVLPGTYTAIGTLAAVRWRRGGGRGQLVELSKLEAMVAANRYFETDYAQNGQFIGRNGPMLYPYYGYTPAADGWTAPCAVTGRHVRLVAEMMGCDEVPEAEELAAWFASHDRAELFHGGQARGIPWGFLATAPEVLAHEQLRTRSSFAVVDHPVIGSVEVPATASHQVATDGGVRPAHRLGADGDRLDEFLARRRPMPAPSPVDSNDALPLSSIRILDLTSWWAGPMGAMILADLGAEVIKVESTKKMDAWRTTLADTTSPIPWETSPLYNSAGRNKLGLTLDLTDERGCELLCALVAESDVVIENLQPKVLPSLGLGYEIFRRHNPQLVMVSQSGFGQTGPWKDYGSLAQVGESLGGVGYITGHTDGRPMFAGNFIGDTLSATHAAFATLAALHERARTGQGQHVDLSQLESTLPVAAEALLDHQVNGRLWGRIGNRHPSMAPHGCYPTRTDDEWVTLAIADDDEWRVLAGEIDQPWALDPHLATTAGRAEAIDELDAELLTWFVTQDRAQTVARLQALGLRVGPVHSPPDVLADPHLEARGFFQTIDREVVGPLPYPGLGIRFHDTPAVNRMPAPLLGEHNHDVLSRVLGLDDAAIAELEQHDIIGTEPVAPPAAITMQGTSDS